MTSKLGLLGICMALFHCCIPVIFAAKVQGRAHAPDVASLNGGHMARAEQQTLADVVDGFLDTNVAALYEQFLDSCLSPSKNDTVVEEAELNPIAVLYAWIAAIEEHITELEPPIQVRIIAGAEMMTWDMYAAYTNKSVAIYSGSKYRLPPSMATPGNLAITWMYGWFKYTNFMLPYYTDVWSGICKSFNVTVDVDNGDPSTPGGVGNLAVNDFVEAFAEDGFNQLGDLTPEGGFVDGYFWSRWNYSDYTGFVPANDGYKITDATKWQPLVIPPTPPYGGGCNAATGSPYVQNHIVPQAGLAKRLTYKGNLTEVYDLPPPIASMDPASAAYKAQADEVLSVSANLTDSNKMQAQFFDNKFTGLAVPILFLVQAKNLNANLTQLMLTVVAKGMALLDANAEAWAQKIRFNSVRPITAIRYLYGKQNITPYRGTRRMTGKGYRSFLKTMQHAEYVSGSACYCAAEMAAFQNLYGDDVFGLNYTYPAGSSVIEPGTVPAQNLTLFWPTYTDYSVQCARSRVLGGVHFTSSTLEALKLCSPIGKAAVMRALALNDGTDSGPIPVSMLKEKAESRKETLEGEEGPP